MSDEQEKGSLERSVLDETLEDHRTMRQVLGEVEACLDRQPDRQGTWIASLTQRLRALQQTMEEHFQDEEEGALFRKLPISHPRLAGRFKKLEEEHSRVLETIKLAVQRAQMLGEAEIYELREFNAQVQLLVATIQRHEAEENELVMEAHWSTVGTGD